MATKTATSMNHSNSPAPRLYNSPQWVITMRDSGGWGVGVNGREQYRSGGCVDLDRAVSVGVGLSGQHCTRPLDKYG